MVGVKNNLAPISNGLAYRIEATGLVPRIAWQQGVVTLDANTVLSADRGDGVRKDACSEEAETWLLSQLVPGVEMPVSEIMARAGAMNFSWRTIERVKEKAGVRAVRRGPGWIWVLA